MKLVFVTQQLDPDHPALAATVAKVRALAELVDEIVVLADGVESALPVNGRTRTFRAATRAGRGARFELALARELRGLRGGAVIAHMCPIYAVLAAPVVRPARIPLVLWFTHWRASRLLRLAERASSAVTSVDRRSFPLDSSKVRAIGHGVDFAELPCSPPREDDGFFRLLALGRYSPAKGLETVLHAVARVGADVRLDIRGPTLSAEEREHRADLERLVERLALEERVTLGDAVPPADVPALLAASDGLVNNMRAGALDKVVYEACAACRPVLASNPALDSLLDPEQRFERDDPESLAVAIRALRASSVDDRATLGSHLRKRVEERHSVQSWARGILSAARIER